MTRNVDRDELLQRLSDGITSLTTSTTWHQYLDMQAKFTNYSPRNVTLILLQNPDATHVAGYRTWESLGRQVRKGEVSLRILAPLRYTLADPETGQKESAIKGFKLAPVFDVSQTDGDPLVDVTQRLTGGDPDGLYDELLRVAQGLGYTVEDADLGGEVNGDTTYSLHRIRVELANAPAQRAKTLAHELGHAILHEDAKHMERELVELEAESVAYVVCQSFGLETGDYSFGYVAGWAGAEKAQELILESAKRIQSAAKTIVQQIEANTAVTPDASPAMSEHGLDLAEPERASGAIAAAAWSQAATQLAALPPETVLSGSDLAIGM
jgi:hypothetical protein